PGGLRTERGDIELGWGARPRVELGLLEAKPAAVHRHRLAGPEPADRLEAGVEAGELLGRAGPVDAERRLVERLAGADAEEDPAGIHLLEAHERLGDHAGVVAVEDGRHAGADREPGQLADGAEPDPCVARLTFGEPRSEVV